MQKNMYEIFDELEAAPNKESAKAILYYNMTPALRLVLRANYHPGIKFTIDKIPEYKENDSPVGLSETNIHKEIHRLYLFEEGNTRVSPNLSLERKKEILVQILEGLEAREAKVYADMIMKKLKLKHVNRSLIEEVVPGLFSY
jgi:hypothetical protein